MGGGGGNAGGVEFPDYVMDTHGRLMAGEAVSSDTTYSSTPSVTPNTTVLGVLNTALSTNPYENFGSFTNPNTDFDDMDTEWGRLDTLVGNYATSSIQDIVGSALDAVDVSTAGLNDLCNIRQLPDAEDISLTFETSALTTSLSVLTQAYDEVKALSPNASTPDWQNIINDAASTLQNGGVMSTTDMVQVVDQSLSNATNVLNNAKDVAQSIANSTEVLDLINDFASRREETWQRQVSKFNAQMADANAVNSSAYMFGLSLLKSRQGREEARFDAELTSQVFQQAISQYSEAYAQSLQAQTQAELTDVRRYNALLQDSVQSILQIALNERNRDNISKTDLVSLFGQIFQAELQASIATSELQTQIARTNAQQSRFNAELARDEEELNLQAQQINKQAREQRYVQALQITNGLLTNKVEFRDAITRLKTEQKRLRVAGRKEYESQEMERLKKEGLWDMSLMDQANQVLAAPGGMARRLPEDESRTASALGGALSGAGTGAAVGSVVPGIGTGIGAGVGAVVGGLGGFLGA